MASTVWKGYISFGLVSVPVRLYAAAREQHVSFNQIHEPCGSRIKQQTVCPVCNRVAERNELVKGYQVDRDAYVLVTSDELKTLEADSSEAMEIAQFVSLSEVDPIYYESSYYTAPEDAGRRAYGLLLQAMEKLNVAAIAKVTLHQREQIVLMRPYHQGIILHTLYYPAEVREVSEYGKTENMNVQKPEIDLAEQFIRQLTSKFEPEQYKDEYQQRVLDLVETKRAGQVIAGQAQKPRLAPVIDLMEALKKSIAARSNEAAAPALVEPGTRKGPKSAPAAEPKPSRRRKTG
ncbi:MAG TPA: Ku protein [Acidobacteriaceae bacterium]|nr:Ku protein [Acidobacteriaceae bacterium]